MLGRTRKIRRRSNPCRTSRGAGVLTAHIGYRTGVSAVETILMLVGIPVAVVAIVSLLVFWPSFTSPRSRTSEDWEYDPVLWVADPERLMSTVGETGSEAAAAQSNTAHGGARGNW